MFRVKAVVVLLLFTCAIWCQVKGVKPVQKTKGSGTTRAIVIGISDYQHVSDLSYADKDAFAFASYLRTAAGGSIDSNNIKLLLNEAATSAQTSAALDWLIAESKEGDKAFIYFSGHGDAQSNLKRTPAYLLCWDSPDRSYAACNLPVYLLNDYIQHLNTSNVKTVLIVDACRSGKLSGNYVNGPLLTNDFLSKNIGNELRMLSCGSNQYSIEGTQWGGGRGVFSYHLVNALYGMADADKDNIVTVVELSRYLEDHVSREVSPQKQIPLIVSEDRDEIISAVNHNLLSQQMGSGVARMDVMGIIESKNLEEEVISSVDTSIRRYYKLFKQALKEKQLLKPVDACADYYYELLINEPSMEKLHAFMRRNYAAVLQDDAQQMMNSFLAVNVSELNRLGKDRIEKYKDYPVFISRAIELLGEKHYLYNALNSRKYLFEGLILYLENASINSEETGLAIMNNFYKSIFYQQDNPVSHFYLAEFFASTTTKFNNKDSFLLYSNNAIHFAESWILPYAYQVYNLSKYFKDTTYHSELISRAWVIDSNDLFLIKSLAAQHFYRKELDRAVFYYKKGIEIDSTDAMMWLNLGACAQEQKQELEAEKYFLKSIEVNPRQFHAYNFLGFLYYNMKEFQKAEGMYLQALGNGPKKLQVRGRLSLLYLSTGQTDLLEKQCSELEKLDPKGWQHYYYRACDSAIKGDNQKALSLLEKSLQANMNDIDELNTSKFLGSIRNSIEFKFLMKKYFPKYF